MIRQREILLPLDRLFGRALVRLLGLRPRPSPPSPVPELRRFLILRPGGMGDAILLIPLLRALKERFPAATIEILAERRNAEIFGLVEDLVSVVFRYDRLGEFLRVLARRYDAVIDTEQWYRLSAVAARLIRAPIRCGFATNERSRLFDIPVGYDPGRYEAENFLAGLAALTGEPVHFDPTRPFLTNSTPVSDASGFVLISPGASYPEKQWGLGKFRELTEGLAADGRPVGLIGGTADIPLAGDIVRGLPIRNFVGRTSLQETARLIAAAELVIGGDSVALHLAAAFGTPSIALFGPTAPSQWAPRGKGHRTLHHPPPCSPCSRFGYIPPCPYEVDCLKRISVEEVLATAREILPVGPAKAPGG
ncbi:MAG TPA: glycosyltransferase family 9 protein [Nitrospiria bacterium]|nr:glycosyltransferase family 9 protein [Nitrospiria bacterium]